MATKNTTLSERPQRAAPTPENTPIPGGGRWRWNGTGWTELFETTTLAPTTRDPAPAASESARQPTLSTKPTQE